jgi:phosphoglycolate phosphatase
LNLPLYLNGTNIGMTVKEEKKLVIFDLDGTLIDAYSAIIKSFNFTVEKLGLAPVLRSDVISAVGWGDKNLLRPFFKKSLLGKALSIYRRHHQISLTRYARVISGARRLLYRLKKKGYVLAVASNRPTVFSMILLRHLRLADFFDVVLCADKAGRLKPHPEIINKIISKTGITATRTVYIGDMSIDAQTGRRAGVKTVIVKSPSSVIKQIKKEKPALIINGLNELDNALNCLLKKPKKLPTK